MLFFFTKFAKVASMSKLEHRREVAKKNRLWQKDGAKNIWCDALNLTATNLHLQLSKSICLKYQAEIVITYIYVWLALIYSK